jgi:cob(I)alamin adenosyltransferase
MVKIYTKSGDNGTTSLFSGQRVEKSSISIHALGAVDECNSTIGLAVAFLPEADRFSSLKKQLLIIQHALFDLGAHIATPRTRSSDAKLASTSFEEEAVAALEKWIDAMEESLPQLKSFILPGGGLCGAHLHLARSVCRRAERSIVDLAAAGDVSQKALKYINRLSDYLFVASRYVNFLQNCPETPWQKHLLEKEENIAMF